MKINKSNSDEFSTSKIPLFDMTYYLTGGFWLSLPLFLNIPLGVLRSIVFARFLEQSVYGKFGFVNGLISTFDFLTLNGISIALTGAVARGNESSIIIASKTRFRWGFLSSFCLLIIGLVYLLKGDTDLFITLLVCGILIPVNSALMLVVSFNNGLKRFNYISIINLAISFLSTLSLILVAYFGMGLIWLIVANLGSQIVIYGLSYSKILRDVKDKPDEEDLISYGKKLTWANMITSVSNEMDNAILGVTSGFVNVAIYNIASVIPNALRPFTKMILPLAIPKMAETQEKPLNSQNIKKSLMILILFNLIIILISLVFTPFLIPLFYTDKYSSSIVLAQILVLSLTFGMPTYYLSALLQGRKKTKQIYQSNLFNGILQLGTLVVLTPLLGTLGVVISRVITSWATFFYLWLLIAKS